jgi:hypothetical protein
MELYGFEYLVESLNDLKIPYKIDEHHYLTIGNLIISLDMSSFHIDGLLQGSFDDIEKITEEHIVFRLGLNKVQVKYNK